MDATRFLAYRRALKMTQLELAAALDVTPTTVARWERGIHRVGRVLELALSHLALMHGAAPVGEIRDPEWSHEINAKWIAAQKARLKRVKTHPPKGAK